MGKRKRLTEESVDTVVAKLLNLINKDAQGDLFAKQLLLLKSRLLTKGDYKIQKAAGDFTLGEVVQLFELNYSDVVSAAATKAYRWKIEDEKLDFPMTPRIESLVENYSKNFDRSSEAVCRTALDFMLNECLTVLKGNHVEEEGGQKTSARRQKTPTPFNDIRVHGEVSFNHEILPPSKNPQRTSPTVVTGRLDYGIGRVLMPTSKATASRLRNRFQSFLVIVEAKAQRAVGAALPQLLVYLACLRQARLQRRRTDASVYGVASDGYIFSFVKITHKGTVAISRDFNVQHGEMLEVLQCLRYILEMTAEMSPNVTPERNNADGNGADEPIDPAIDLYDNDYTNPPQGDDDDDEEIYVDCN